MRAPAAARNRLLQGRTGPLVRDGEKAGYAEAEEGQREKRVGPEPEAAVHRPADHSEAVDRSQRDAQRREPGVQVSCGRENRLTGDEIRHEEEADLERVAAEDVSHRERVVTQPYRR